MKNLSCFLFSALLAVFATSCSKNSKQEGQMLVTSNEVASPSEVKQNNLASATTSTTLPITPLQSAREGTVTFNKADLSNKTYIYGASLQTSSITDKGLATALMAISLGTQPAKFFINGSKLKLVTDGTVSFESDVNHPSRLIQEFDIVSETEETVTVALDKASKILSHTWFGADAGQIRHSWLRSIDYVSNKNLLLIESTIETNDDSVAEFMEFLAPREQFIPANAKPIYDNADLNADAERYGFLGTDQVFVTLEDGTRAQTSIAQRFYSADGAPISWYVTANAPDANLIDIKNGIEAWNRYSQKMWGRDMIKFEGKLPEGVKLGDPRFNIVAWDNVQDAGAAYESQNGDLLTGVQVNSMVYMPLAWLNIGEAYWKNGKFSEAENSEKISKIKSILATKKFGGRSLPVTCIESATNQISLTARESPKEFARSLLKGVIFHEVGHALGLAHNFKGSLAFDQDTANPLVSNSVMDYNLYNEEGGMFSSLESSEGPVLEYDRQIISVLYNEGKDVKESDPVVPYCSDSDADSMKGGVDPLCARYDLGKDPTKVALMGFALISEPASRLGRAHSLPKALEQITNELPKASDINKMDDASKALTAYLASTRAIVRFYISNWTGFIEQSNQSLRIFRANSLPESLGLEENKMRIQAISALDQALTIQKFPNATAWSIESNNNKFINWLLTTPLYASMTEDQRQKAVDTVKQKFSSYFNSQETTILANAKVRIYATMNYSNAAPMSIAKSESAESGKIDLEKVVVEYLQKAALSETKLINERVAAAAALATYKNTEVGATALAAVISEVDSQIRNATDATTREALRTLKASLR